MRLGGNHYSIDLMVSPTVNSTECPLVGVDMQRLKHRAICVIERTRMATTRLHCIWEMSRRESRVRPRCFSFIAHTNCTVVVNVWLSLILSVNCLVSVLKGVGQTSLAYLTAATHGFDEEAEQLKAELESKGQPLPPIDPNAKVLMPPPPLIKVITCHSFFLLLPSLSSSLIDK